MRYTEPVHARLINNWEGNSTNLATVRWYKMLFSIHLQDSLSATSSLSRVSRVHIDKGISFTVTQQSNDQIDRFNVQCANTARQHSLVGSRFWRYYNLTHSHPLGLNMTSWRSVSHLLLPPLSLMETCCRSAKTEPIFSPFCIKRDIKGENWI